MRIFENANFKFIENRKIGYIISGTLLLLSMGSLLINGLEMGIDFRGGMEFVVEMDEVHSATEMRSVLGAALGQEPEVKTYGTDGNALLIRAATTEDMRTVQEQIISAIQAEFATSNPRMIKTDVVGPRFAQDLQRGALYSILGSLLVIFVYILIRFEWRFSVGAVAALFHDVIVVLGLFSLLRFVMPFSLQIDQTIIAAFLTIVGYSLNDTVVIFDRIREYAGIFKSEKYENVVNRSINNTLSRTVITSGTTLIVVVILFIFGGEVLRGFTFALIMGIVIGTYSTVFVASPIMLALRQKS